MNLEEKFVKELKEVIVEDNLRLYAKFVHEKDPNQIKSEEWRKFMAAVGSHDAEGAVSVVFRQVLVDALANVLGVLDGSSTLPSMRGEFRITYDGELLDKSLADTFWASE
jgi:hypothetical protein